MWNLTCHGSLKVAKTDYAKACDPSKIYTIEEVSFLLNKVNDCFIGSDVMIGGSLATYHALNPEFRGSYGQTMGNYDIDIFVLSDIRSVSTYAFKHLITNHLGCTDLEKPADPDYYKMEGIWKVYSLHHGKLNRKVNLVIINRQVYGTVRNFLAKAMGHSLAACCYINRTVGNYPTLIHLDEFKKCQKGKVVRWRPELMTNLAVEKMLGRTRTLGFTAEAIKKPLGKLPKIVI